MNDNNPFAFEMNNPYMYDPNLNVAQMNAKIRFFNLRKLLRLLLLRKSARMFLLLM